MRQTIAYKVLRIRWKNSERISWIKSKIYSYLINDSSEDKKVKGKKKLCHKNLKIIKTV